MVVKLRRHEKILLRRLEDREIERREKKRTLFWKVCGWLFIAFELFQEWCDQMADCGHVHLFILLRMFAASLNASDGYWYVKIALRCVHYLYFRKLKSKKYFRGHWFYLAWITTSGPNITSGLAALHDWIRGQKPGKYLKCCCWCISKSFLLISIFFFMKWPDDLFKFRLWQMIFQSHHSLMSSISFPAWVLQQKYWPFQIISVRFCVGNCSPRSVILNWETCFACYFCPAEQDSNRTKVSNWRNRSSLIQAQLECFEK